MAGAARTVLVAGATGALGLRVARLLAARGDRIVAVYRTERTEALAELAALGCEAMALDLADVGRAAALIAKADTAVLTPILTVAGPAARAVLAQGWRGRLVLFSSNNVAIDAESPTYAALRAEESALAQTPGDWTLVRPTMIYGHAEDGNLARLLRLAHRWPVVPLPGAGRALQQPIHIDDLAALAVHLLDAPAGGEHVIAAAGPKPASLRALYEAAAAAAGRPGAVMAVPLTPLRLLARAAGAFGLPFPLDADQLARIELDKTPIGSGPTGWRPSIGVKDGLARLARELGLSGSA
jgi:nucleoside-diphosphate-sugar epimerase